MVHGMELTGAQPAGPLGRFAANRRLKATMRNADLVLTDSDSAGKDLAARVPDIQARLRTLYPGIGPEWFQAPEPGAAEAARRRYAGNSPFFLHVGNFGPHGNVDMLVRGFVALAAQQKAFGRRLLLVSGRNAGRPPADDNMFRSAVMADVVRICRDVPDSDLRALYAGAEWFVTASRGGSFGFHAAEAMAMGCPIIYHPCEPLSELVGDCALSIPATGVPALTDTLHKAIIYSEAARSVLIARAKSRVTVFTTTAASQSMADMLNSLVGNAAGRG